MVKRQRNLIDIEKEKDLMERQLSHLKDLVKVGEVITYLGKRCCILSLSFTRYRILIEPNQKDFTLFDDEQIEYEVPFVKLEYFGDDSKIYEHGIFYEVFTQAVCGMKAITL